MLDETTNRLRTPPFPRIGKSSFGLWLQPAARNWVSLVSSRAIARDAFQPVRSSRARHRSDIRERLETALSDQCGGFGVSVVEFDAALERMIDWPLRGTPPPSPTRYESWSPRSTLACYNDGLRAGRRVHGLTVVRRSRAQRNGHSILFGDAG